MKKLLCLISLILLLTAGPVLAVDMTGDDPIGASSLNTAGKWSDSLAPSAGKTYFNKGYLIRTAGGNVTFAGDSLTIGTGGASFPVDGTVNTNCLIGKSNTGAVVTINDLILDGGYIRDGLNESYTWTIDGNLTITAIGGGFGNQCTLNVAAAIKGSGPLYVADNANGNAARVNNIQSSANTYNGSIYLLGSAANRSRITFADNSVMNFVIGASGVSNKITVGTGKQGTAVFNGDFKFDLSAAGTNEGDSWKVAGATTQTFGETFTVIDFTDAGNNLWTKVQNGVNYEFNESTGTLSVKALPIRDPNPADGATNVALTTTKLSWKGSEVSNGLPDPNIVKYYVWTNEDNPSVSTMTLQGMVAVGTTSSASYTLGVSLVNDKTYSWQIEQAMNTGSGNSGDPNNLLGPIWSFSTPATVPVISANPQNVKVKADGTEQAVFTVSYTCDVPVTGVTWYLNNIALGSVNVAWNQQTSTLSIPSVGPADLGSYHCVVMTAGGSTPSQAALLVEKKLLAQYQFENNVNDSAGTNHGTLAGVVSGMSYSTELAGMFAGQSFAADPNGGVYAQLSTDAYPKAGFGNGLDEGTVSYWVKIAPDAFGSIIGNYNGAVGTTPAITGLRTRVDNAGKVHFHVRDEDGSQGEPISVKVVDDNQWHLVTAVITKTSVTLYTDVTDKVIVTTASPLDNFAAWQHPLVLMAMNNRSVPQDMFPGVLDDLKIYNYPMTQEDVAQEYFTVTEKSSCIYPNLPGLAFDFDKNCKVDMADLMTLAAEWLNNGLYPNL